MLLAPFYVCSLGLRIRILSIPTAQKKQFGKGSKGKRKFVFSNLECGCFEGRLTDQERVHDAAQGPDIRLESVSLLVQHLRRDVVRGPADGPTAEKFGYANFFFVWK